MSASSSPRHSGLADFFAPDVFQAVLNDPATAARLKSFCESSACSENIAFLEKIDQYSRLLNQAQELLSDIHATYTAPNATEPINVSESISKRVTSNIETTTNATFPMMQDIFLDAREHVECLIREDIYPRFVIHQVTASASMALAEDRTTYRGLGDCFCLTDPKVADNAILYASDGFVNVTGYSRRDIVPRNCRFLQGPKTDRPSVTRLKCAIDDGNESVELLLNYRKDGTPFWNLLYVTPLRDEDGNIAFFLGGQIDCSTTIRGNPDVLKILEFDSTKTSQLYSDGAAVRKMPSLHDTSPRKQYRLSRNMFKSSSECPAHVKHEVGMEDDLIGRIGHMSLETKMQTFRTAYSMFLVLKANDRAGFTIAHYSPSAADLLRLSRARGAVEPIMNEEIFKVLAERSPSSSSAVKSFKKAVTDQLVKGKAVSVDFELLVQENCQTVELKRLASKTEKQMVSHWTPCKDEEGRAKYIVLVLVDR